MFSDWEQTTGTAASVFSIIQLLTGIQVCRNFIRKGSTGDASGLPFIVGALNSAIWMKYGFFTESLPVIIVNSFGCILFMSYSTCFYVYTLRSRIQLQKQITFALTFFVTVVTVTDVFTSDASHVRYILGLMGCCISVSFYAAPLASVAHVFRTKSAEVLPLPMILGNFLSGSMWFLYGVSIDDNFVKVPNCLGLMLAGFQLLLFAVYPPGSSHPIHSAKNKSKETLLSIS